MKQDYVILKRYRFFKGGTKGLLMKDYTVMLLSLGENKMEVLCLLKVIVLLSLPTKVFLLVTVPQRRLIYYLHYKEVSEELQATNILNDLGKVTSSP